MKEGKKYGKKKVDKLRPLALNELQQIASVISSNKDKGDAARTRPSVSLSSLPKMQPSLKRKRAKSEGANTSTPKPSKVRIKMRGVKRKDFSNKNKTDGNTNKKKK